MLKKILLAVVSWRLVLVLLTYLATWVLPFNNQFTPYRNHGIFVRPLPYPVVVFANFDGVHYIEIAKRGYHLLEQPFLPLYPLVIRSVATIFKMDFIISAQLISVFALLTSLLIFYKLLVFDKQKKYFPLMLLITLIFPTAFFYAAAYNDALFLLLATLTIYCSRKKRWVLACMLAATATLTRFNGFALMILIFAEYLFSEKDSIKSQWESRVLPAKFKKSLYLPKILKSRIYLLALVPAAFLSYLTYVEIIFKNWNLVFTTMEIWGQNRITFPLQVFWRYFKIIFIYPTFKLNYYIAVLEFCYVLFLIFIIIYTFRKIRLSYWLFMVVSLLIPSLTGSFQGMPRYGLHLYPLFLTLAMIFYKKTVRFKFIICLLSLVLGFLVLSLFTRGYFVA